jgi:YggT family protein
VVIDIIVDVLYAFLIILFVRILLTWFPINPWSKMARVERALARITDPVLAPVRRVVHPVRIGSMGIDVAPIIVFFALLVLMTVLRSV